MYVVFETEPGVEGSLNTARTLDQAFAQIACRCGYSYHFEGQADGWKLVLFDVERPEHSPDPIHSRCLKPTDAQYDLMSQAVDGRLKGHIALPIDTYKRTRLRPPSHGAQAHTAAP
jgi:hypothetical protein